jgi:hypothetical protein
MLNVKKEKIIKELKQIPGVGKSVAEDLWLLNISAVSDLENQDPEQLYQSLCLIRKQKIDRCMLYVFRCAVYYASTKNPKSELLKWWNWKN